MKPRVIMSVRKPSITLFGDFLSHAECDQLIEEARPHLTMSSVYTDEAPKGSVNDNVRNSLQTQMSGERATELSKMIDDRSEALFRLQSWPLTVLNYQVGGKFLAHLDAYSPTLLSRGVVGPGTLSPQRVGSLIVYLNDLPVAGGGSTRFPIVGLDFRPVKGNAIFFTYPDPNDNATTHESMEVKSGEKWAAVKWFSANHEK